MQFGFTNIMRPIFCFNVDDDSSMISVTCMANANATWPFPQEFHGLGQSYPFGDAKTLGTKWVYNLCIYAQGTHIYIYIIYICHSNLRNIHCKLVFWQGPTYTPGEHTMVFTCFPHDNSTMPPAMVQDLPHCQERLWSNTTRGFAAQKDRASEATFRRFLLFSRGRSMVFCLPWGSKGHEINGASNDLNISSGRSSLGTAYATLPAALSTSLKTFEATERSSSRKRIETLRYSQRMTLGVLFDRDNIAEDICGDIDPPHI